MCKFPHADMFILRNLLSLWCDIIILSQVTVCENCRVWTFSYQPSWNVVTEGRFQLDFLVLFLKRHYAIRNAAIIPCKSSVQHKYYFLCTHYVVTSTFAVPGVAYYYPLFLGIFLFRKINSGSHIQVSSISISRSDETLLDTTNVDALLSHMIMSNISPENINIRSDIFID